MRLGSGGFWPKRVEINFRKRSAFDRFPAEGLGVKIEIPGDVFGTGRLVLTSWL
jgi:hypothetical protein